MSAWEYELETLLKRLGVQWDPLPVHDSGAEHLDVDVVDPAELAALEEDDLSDEEWDGLEDEEVDQLSVVRREIQATIGRVARMERAGRLDSVIKDDVLFVLRALCRVQPQLAAGETEEEAQLATSAALLHFCRIVLRLTHALAQQ